MTTGNPTPSTLHVCVFDDMRELPEHMMTDTTVHCKTEEAFFDWLGSLGEIGDCPPVLAVLDHDLGGVAFGEETSRKGITAMVDLHMDGLIDVVTAYVVTMNPSGQDWIIRELERGEIDYEIDVGGRLIGMKVPQGF